MNSLRDILDASPQLRGVRESANLGVSVDDAPQPLGQPLWDWNEIRRVLLIRLRSIGDTVLATPSLRALKRFLPHAEIDILVENWVAPVLAGHESINQIITLDGRSLKERARAAHAARARHYDVVYNLHGGTTATFLTRATGAQHRVGYASYQDRKSVV